MDARFDLVAPLRIKRPLPCRLQGFDLALRRVGAQRVVGGLAQRQALGNTRQGGQIEAVGSQFAARWAGTCGGAVLQAQIAARPAQAVAGDKLQPVGRYLKAAGLSFATQAPLDACQFQRLQLLAQRSADLGQCDIGTAANHCATRHIDPSAHRAVALRHRHACIGGQVVAQLRSIDALEVGKQLPCPLLPIAAVGTEQRLTQFAHQRKALAPRRGRGGVDAQLVAPVAVAQQHIDIAKRQRRRTAQLVAPAQRATAHHHFGLVKQPVGGAGVARIAV